MALELIFKSSCTRAFDMQLNFESRTHYFREKPPDAGFILLIANMEVLP